MTNSDFLAELYGEIPKGEYGWVCSFSADPSDAPPDVWSGRPYNGGVAQAGLIDRAVSENTYFCPALLGLVDGEMVRRKSAFVQLMALVVDDVQPDDIAGQFSYSIQTSPGKFQVGILLDPRDADCSNLELVDRVMMHLSSRGLIKNDTSGNNAVRLLRLPRGMNTKARAAGAWTVQLEHWNPSMRYSLDDAVAALGIDLAALRHAVNVASSTTKASPGAGSHAGDFVAGITGPLEDRAYHDNLIKLAASLVAGGMFPGAAVSYLYSLMDASKPVGPESEVLRWQARRAEIPRAVKSAEKFAPPERAPAQVTVNLGQPVEASPSDPVPLDWMALAGREPRQVEWAVEGWLPRGHVTLLSANGGVGKSTAALQMAVSICKGMPWLGLPVAQGSVMVVSAEDGTDLVHARVANICQAQDVSLQALHRDLVVYDLSEQDSVLWRDGAPTVRMQWFADAVNRVRPSVVILDNASDVYADNENDRATVRGFLRCLKTIASGTDAAILLLAHVDKASVRSGAGNDTDTTFSGSTAWNNTARSRWAMVLADDREIVLKHEKCNVGPKSPAVSIEYDAGAHIFREFGTIPGAAAAAAVVRNANQVAILKLIDQAVNNGQRLSLNAKSNNNVYFLLEKAPGFPRVARKDFFGLMFQMQRDGLIGEVEYRMRNRAVSSCIELTAAGKMRIAMSGVGDGVGGVRADGVGGV